MANICAYAATDKLKPIAIIVPAEPALKKLAKENSVEGNGLEDLVHSEKLNSIILKELQNVGRQAGLTGVEIIDGVVLADEEWTAANVSKRLIQCLLLGQLLTHAVGPHHGGPKDKPQGDLEQVSERG